jgi:hypothetical protein
MRLKCIKSNIKSAMQTEQQLLKTLFESVAKEALAAKRRLSFA